MVLRICVVMAIPLEIQCGGQAMGLSQDIAVRWARQR
jgi:hypothetical protein